MTMDLLDGQHVNDYNGVIKTNGWREITSDFKTQKEEVSHKLKAIKPKSFKFNTEMQFLYTIVDKVMLTWNLSLLLKQKNHDQVPMCVTALDPFKH